VGQAMQHQEQPFRDDKDRPKERFRPFSIPLKNSRRPALSPVASHTDRPQKPRPSLTRRAEFCILCPGNAYWQRCVSGLTLIHQNQLRPGDSQEEENIRGKESYLLLVCQRTRGEPDRHCKINGAYPTGHRLCCRPGKTIGQIIKARSA